MAAGMAGITTGAVTGTATGLTEARQVHRVGEAIEFRGYAHDYDTAIASVQFSLDGGEHWTDYPVKDATSGRWVRWRFSYTPTRPGVYLLESRSVNVYGKASPTPAAVQFEVVG